jgi:class I lanthipeptide synthase
VPQEWLTWLREVWALPGFADAVTQATPDLADQTARALAGEPLTERSLTRLTQSTLRYVLRWTSRPTPFGRFAGVAPIGIGRAALIRWNDAHRGSTVADGVFVAERVARAEQDLTVLRRCAVMTNSLGYRRDRVWVLPCARASGGHVSDVEIDVTEPIRLALAAAATPVAFSDLATHLLEKLPACLPEAVDQLLAGLVQAGALISQARPPSTATDPIGHLARHTGTVETGGRPGVDVRLDCSITLPHAVAREACEAATALALVAPRLPGWTEYHHAFIERWGPGAAVPLRDVLNVLGYPAGYRGSTRREPARFTARDALLHELAQRAVLDGGGTDMVLDDPLIDALRGDDDRPPLPHTELRFTLAAATPRQLDTGDFTLTVVSGARHAGVSAGRFLHLLAPSELGRFEQVYQTLPTATAGAAVVQVSAPVLDHRLAGVARTPRILEVMPVGEHHDDPWWTVSDLVVAADSRRLWLASGRTGQPVEPLLFNSVALPAGQQPLVRFLTEIWAAFTAPCMPFDWGHARTLPFLPCVRRGRSILHPARWIITATQLPPPAAPWPRWLDAWTRQRDQLRLPRELLVGASDVRMRIDLDEPAHLWLMRNHLDRHRRATLNQAPGPSGWLDGRPAELLLTLVRDQRHPPTPVPPARPVATVQHRPGHGQWLDARYVGNPEHILTHLAAQPDLLPDGAWFLRYPEPQPHLRLRIPHAADRFADAARRAGELAARLDQAGILADYSLATYRPETRHGHGPTLAAAQAVFAADSRAALRWLDGDRQARTAAGMTAIVAAFTADGPRWLAEHVPHHSGARLDPGQRRQARAAVHDEPLAAALSAYRSAVDRDGENADQILGVLLHLHHARMIGEDIDSERHCLRLARAVALTTLASRHS